MRLWNRNFVLLMQGAFVSNIGDMLYSLAIGYYVFELTGSEAMLGLFSSITMLGFLVLGPIAGAFVDRLDRKGVMVWMDALRGVIMLVIGWLCMVNQLSTGVLMLLIPEDCRSTVIGFVMASSMGGSALSNIFYGLVAERVPLQIAGTVGMLLAVVPIIMLFASAEVRSKIIGKPLQDM